MRRLVLFDIDGTVLSGGPAKEAFHRALVEVFGTAGPVETWEFSGKTDPQIARELLTEAGVEGGAIEQGLPSLWSRYLEGMKSRLPACPARALPGAESLLRALVDIDTVAVGLLTGNVMEGAKLKLRSAGLSRWLSVGAFGSDSELRTELPAIAVRRANRHWRADFAPEDLVVVGDTPRDVHCGQSYGTRTVAVATGRFSCDALNATGADVVLSGLEQTDEAMAAILG